MSPRPSGLSRLPRSGVLALLALVAAAACTLEERTDANRVPRNGTLAGEPPRRAVVEVEGVPRLPVFSTAVRSGDLLFLSGQIGTEPGVDPPRLVGGGVEAETRQALAHVRTVLAAEGLGMEDVVKCTLFLDSMDDFAAVNRIYAAAFPGAPPARSAMAVEELALGAAMEIECIAAYPAAP